MKRFMVLSAIFFLLVLVSPVFAEDMPAPAMPAALDVVTLKDGSVIYGEVVEMSGGLLHVKNALASDLIKVKWAEVSKLAVSHPIPFHLKEGP